MICCILSTTGAAMNYKIMRKYIDWEIPKLTPYDHRVVSKILCGTRLHTYIRIMGYCFKGKGEDHFQCVHRNVTLEGIAKKMEE